MKIKCQEHYENTVKYAKRFFKCVCSSRETVHQSLQQMTDPACRDREALRQRPLSRLSPLQRNRMNMVRNRCTVRFHTCHWS